MCSAWCVCGFSCVWLLHSPWAESLRLLCPWDFSRQEYWSGFSFPTPGDLPNPGNEPMSLVSHALASRSSPLHHLESLRCSAWTSGKISRASRVLGVSFPHHFAPIDEVPPPPPNSLLQGGRCKSCLSLSRRFLLGLQNHWYGDCNHEIKRLLEIKLLPGKKL